MISSQPVQNLQQLEQIIADMPKAERCSKAVIFRGHQYTDLWPLNWSTVMELSSESMVQTAQRIIEFAHQLFIEKLKQRFIEPSSPVMNSWFGKLVANKSSACGCDDMQMSAPANLEKLHFLSRGMVERIAHIYGLHIDDVGIHAEALIVENIAKFLRRVEQEANQVDAFYLGDSHLQSEYISLANRKHTPQEAIDFLNKLAREGCKVYCPFELETDGCDYSEVMSLELLTAHVIYKLPLLNSEQISKLHFDIFVQGHGVVRYVVGSPIDLWSGLIAYRFTPDLQSLCPSQTQKEVPPDILSIRGTQRHIDLPGFLGSMISIWHPKGPGANVLKSHSIINLEAIIQSSSSKWIFAGHSMGAEIASALSKRPNVQGKILRVYSFSNPGRNKYHTLYKHKQNHAHHFVSYLDPIVQLGSNRDGNVTLVFNGQHAKPLNIFEMANRVVEYIQNHHSRPQFLGNSCWIATKMPEAEPIAGYNPIWGIAHRFISHHFYGPWKMVAHVAVAVWPFIKLLALSLAELVHSLWMRYMSKSNFHLAIEASVAVENPDTTSGKAPVSV